MKTDILARSTTGIGASKRMSSYITKIIISSQNRSRKRKQGKHDFLLEHLQCNVGGKEQVKVITSLFPLGQFAISSMLIGTQRKTSSESLIQRSASCEFHFKQSVHRHATKLGCQKEESISKSNKMVNAMTIPDYEPANDAMLSFLMTATQENVESWLKWWNGK